jgi:hypothetical protein
MTRLEEVLDIARTHTTSGRMPSGNGRTPAASQGLRLGRYKVLRKLLTANHEPIDQGVAQFTIVHRDRSQQ